MKKFIGYEKVAIIDSDGMYGYLQCLCDMGMIMENTRSKMFTDL